MLKLKDYIGYISGIVGVVSFVFALGIKSANKDNHNAGIEKKVDILVKNDSLKTVQYYELLEFNKILVPYMEKQDQLIQNYSNFVQDNTRSVQEWKTYMNGLTFEIIQQEPMKSIFPETKIKIIKKND
jgi:hypothetical protein